MTSYHWYDPPPSEGLAITTLAGGGGGAAAAPPAGCFFHLTDSTWAGTPLDTPVSSPDLYFVHDDVNHLDYQAGYYTPDAYWGSDVSSVMPALTLEYATDGRPILEPGTYYLEYQLNASLQTALPQGSIWQFKIDQQSNSGNSLQIATLPEGTGNILGNFSATFTVFESSPTGIQVGQLQALGPDPGQYDTLNLNVWMTLMKLA